MNCLTKKILLEKNIREENYHGFVNIGFLIKGVPEILLTESYAKFYGSEFSGMGNSRFEVLIDRYNEENCIESSAVYPCISACLQELLSRLTETKDAELKECLIVIYTYKVKMWRKGNIFLSHEIYATNIRPLYYVATRYSSDFWVTEDLYGKRYRLDKQKVNELKDLVIASNMRNDDPYDDPSFLQKIQGLLPIQDDHAKFRKYVKLYNESRYMVPPTFSYRTANTTYAIPYQIQPLTEDEEEYFNRISRDTQDTYPGLKFKENADEIVYHP